MSAAEPSPFLRVEHLTMRFGGLTAVDDLSFEAVCGDVTALIGPNGAGKTTVFNCVTGFYRPTSGRICFVREGSAGAGEVDALTRSGRRYHRKDGHEIFLLERMRDHEICREAGVARTFQNIRLFAGMTLLENLVVAQHNPLMRASGMTILGLAGSPSYAASERRPRSRSARATRRGRSAAWLSAAGPPGGEAMTTAGG